MKYKPKFKIKISYFKYVQNNAKYLEEKKTNIDHKIDHKLDRARILH